MVMHGYGSEGGCPGYFFCDRCDGKGWITDPGRPCRKCGGVGWEECWDCLAVVEAYYENYGL